MMIAINENATRVEMTMKINIHLNFSPFLLKLLKDFVDIIDPWLLLDKRVCVESIQILAQQIMPEMTFKHAIHIYHWHANHFEKI